MLANEREKSSYSAMIVRFRSNASIAAALVTRAPQEIAVDAQDIGISDQRMPQKASRARAMGSFGRQPAEEGRGVDFAVLPRTWTARGPQVRSDAPHP